MSSSSPTAERKEQKERTRQKLLRAARALVEDGKTLTVARAAEAAAVAEATAYRYYRNPRSLLRDALAVDWPALDELIAELRAMPLATCFHVDATPPTRPFTRSTPSAC